ncbi:MAG: sugar ABC transporter permease [Candidatus Vecturithrix sp.]|jgi:multiple sugar transport system permease protein|nr:sugar ABC transporter permease [Candidatus Vecturithrix sp.]
MKQINSGSKRSGFSGKRDIRSQKAGLFFVLPAVSFTLIFFIVPLMMTTVMSFYDWQILKGRKFIGLDNYLKLIHDQQFWKSLWFTTEYTLLITPIIFILAFILALLVNQSLRGIGIFRTIYFLPVVIGLSTSSLLWLWMLNDRVGIFNSLLLSLGLISKPIVWLGEKHLAVGAIIVSIVWKTVGFSMILLLTGMQAIPAGLYEAAMVDGAGFWDRIWHIMLPLLRRTFALAVVISVIGSYLAFDQFYIITKGGPRNQTITVVHWIFNNGFTYLKLGYAAALSIVLLVILVSLSTLQMYVLRDDTSY